MVKKASYIFFSLFLFFYFNTVGFPLKLNIRNYTEKDGLPSPKVKSFFQDSTGLLWVGTENGLRLFNGIEFTKYKNRNQIKQDFSESIEFRYGEKNSISYHTLDTLNGITSLIKSKNGNVWISTTENGIYYLEGDKLIRIDDGNHTNSIVYCIKEDKNGVVWFGTSSGLYFFDQQGFRSFQFTDGFQVKNIKRISTNYNGNLILGSDNGVIILKTAPFTYTHYSRKDGLLDNDITALMVDSNDTLWIGTPKGLNKFGEGKFSSYTKNDGLVDDRIYAILEDKDHNIWIGTGDGLSCLSKNKFANYTKKIGLENNFIHSILQDREGVIWVGTNGGLSCITTQNIESYSKSDGFPDNVILTLLQDKKDRYWFGTSSGLSCIEGDTVRNFSQKDGLKDNVVNYLLEDRKENLWIGSTRGISKFLSGVFTSYRDKNEDANLGVFGIIERSDGIYWLGTEKGLICFKNGNFFYPPFHLDKEIITCIIEDSRGDLWFASGVKLYRYTNNQLVDISAHYHLLESPMNLFEDSKSNIWICTQAGLKKFDREKIISYTKAANNLLDDICYCIVEDSRGNLWIGHPNGLSFFNGKTFKTYSNEKMGLGFRTWWRGMKDRHNRLWFATTQGVISFSPPPVSVNSVPPLVLFTSIKVMEKEIPIENENIFKYNQNIFRFNYIGISLSAPKGVYYKYQMENIDKDWQTTRDRSLFYPFLPPGDYTLRVKAFNADGVECEKPAEFQFSILSPFWKTWWFITFVILAILIVLSWFIQNRTRHVKERAELRERNKQLVTSQRMELMGALAAGTVHDLKNLLSVIVGYSRMMSQQYKNHQHEEENLENIEIIKNTATTAVQLSKQILSFARPKDLSTEEVELGTVLSEILETLKVMQPRNIEIYCEHSASPIFFPIQPGRFQQLVMNLCLNAFDAMPDGGRLTVSLSSSPENDNKNEITLTISDTGKEGIKKENIKKIFDPLFTTKKQGTGLGLFVVKQIVEEYKGQIDVRSEQEQGTTFLIRFPSKY